MYFSDIAICISQILKHVFLCLYGRVSDNPGIGGGIYLLLGRNYVRHRLTHSWLAIIYFQQACQFLATNTFLPLKKCCPQM